MAEVDSHHAPLTPQNSYTSRSIVLASGLYALYGIGFAILLLVTLSQHPLVPLKVTDVDWTTAWLVTTVFDYYAAALCLCGFIVATETRFAACLWCSAVLLLGGPFCCSYMIYRLVKHGGLRLA
jgi:hypothetical protein